MDDEQLDYAPRLLERLRELDGYEWDNSVPPFHSSYDIW
jgi:hypothetical protein